MHRQDSEVSIPSRFFASENGSSHPSEVSLHGHDAMENLSWFDRTRLEMARQSLDQGAQSLDLSRASLEISKKSLNLGKISLGASLALGATGLIISGLGMGQDSNGGSANGSASGPASA